MPVIYELRDDIKEYLEARKLFKKWEKAKKLFEQNPEYPSLHTELMEPRHRLIYSFRIDKKYRALFIVMHHALINAGARVGRNCIINTKALVEHDAIIEDHCHISTGAIVNGGVKVGSGSFFGSNAVCKEYIEIGESAVIGCGVKITKNIPCLF